MKCTHYACVGNRAHTLPGTDTSCYAAGDTVTTRGKHFLLGNAHRQHYGSTEGALDVRWEATEVESVDPNLTRERD